MASFMLQGPLVRLKGGEEEFADFFSNSGKLNLKSPDRIRGGLSTE
jgi:hypothetical protein